MEIVMTSKQAKQLLRTLDNSNIIPVTKAASNLAENIQGSKDRPIVITQNGTGLGVVMSVELFQQLRDLAFEGLDHLEEKEAD